MDKLELTDLNEKEKLLFSGRIEGHSLASTQHYFSGLAVK
jgi:hypothetical protein